MSEQSKKLRLNKEDGLKILKGAGYAFGGFAATYLLDLVPRIDWGVWTPVVIPLFAIILNAVVKFSKGK